MRDEMNVADRPRPTPSAATRPTPRHIAVRSRQEWGSFMSPFGVVNTGVAGRQGASGAKGLPAQRRFRQMWGPHNNTLAVMPQKVDFSLRWSRRLIDLTSK